MIKRIAYALAFFVVLSYSAGATSVVSTLADLKTEVRLESGMYSTSYLPDTTLERFCLRALLKVSTDIGGKEGQVSVLTVAGQALYAIADSITQIVHATLISNGKTYTIKAWYPEFVSDRWPTMDGQKFTESFTSGTGDDETPAAYNYWSDTLQLIPVPQKVDTIYLKTFMEYNKDTVDANGVQVNDSYADAVIFMAIHLIYKSKHMYEEAAVYKAEYKEEKNDLIRAYTRKINAAQAPAK